MAERIGIYTGPDLAQIADPEPAQRAMNRMATTGGDRMHAMIAELTPVDTGNLATSWTRMPTRYEMHGPERAWVSRVRTEVDYAPYVEHGTGLWGPEHRKYLIVPKKPGGFLSWVDPRTGRRVFARQVWHPGSPGAHMVSRGVALVHGLLREIMDPELERFKREQEAVMEAARVR